MLIIFHLSNLSRVKNKYKRGLEKYIFLCHSLALRLLIYNADIRDAH